MHLHGSFGLAKSRPRKDAQAQVNGRGIERIDRLFQLNRKAIAGVKLSDSLDQAHGRIRVDATAALLVGICQRTLGDVALYAQVVVELDLVSAQTDFDVAQTLAASQLCEGHAQKLIEMRKKSWWDIWRVALHTAAECVKGEMFHKLCEYQFA